MDKLIPFAVFTALAVSATACIDANINSDSKDYEISHEAVDLGLSVMWATCNVGALKPEDFGGYYAWGEITTKSEYNEVSYSYCHGTDIDGDGWYDCYDGWNEYEIVHDYLGDDISGTRYDVAHISWGNKWRMPTYTEFGELWDNCEFSFTTINGVSAMKITSKVNGNSIFLPAAGYYINSAKKEVGSCGYYWASESAFATGATWLDFDSDGPSLLIASSGRYAGYTIRPVRDY